MKFLTSTFIRITFIINQAIDNLYNVTYTVMYSESKKNMSILSEDWVIYTTKYTQVVNLPNTITFFIKWWHITFEYITLLDNNSLLDKRVSIRLHELDYESILYDYLSQYIDVKRQVVLKNGRVDLFCTYKNSIICIEVKKWKLDRTHIDQVCRYKDELLETFSQKDVLCILIWEQYNESIYNYGREKSIEVYSFEEKLKLLQRLLST